MKELYTIVVAAGRGSRVGAGINKAFLKIADLPLFVRTLKSLNKCNCCEDITVVVAAQEIAYTKNLIQTYKKYFSRLRIKVVGGGVERQDSVWQGLLAREDDYRLVAIHDGARPFVTPEVFTRVYQAAKKNGAAIAAVSATDTVKFVRNSLIEVTADRKKIALAQTPQIFSLPIFLAAYDKARLDKIQVTDDASLVEHYGSRVTVVEGDKDNFKITTPEDVYLANIKCEEEKVQFRVGTGFDVHQFAKGRELLVGGVKIDYKLGLLGHSDADVLLHAISDALLGAAGLGDIGTYFPDTDENYKNADSKELLSQVIVLLQEKGWQVNNIDATIMAEKPKMAPYITKIKQVVADICGVETAAVGIKATTTEKLGFIGRGEGIAAQAVASIKVI